MLHFTDLNINYDSEASVEDVMVNVRYGFSPRRQFKRQPQYQKGKMLLRSESMRSPPPMTIVVFPEPTLSIIDFNTITRDDIEKAVSGIQTKNLT